MWNRKIRLVDIVLHDVIYQEIEIDVCEDDTKSNEKKSAKDTFLLWRQRKTNGYS